MRTKWKKIKNCKQLFGTVPDTGLQRVEQEWSDLAHMDAHTGTL